MAEIPMPANDAATAGDIIARIGQLTRMLRDSMRELGLDQAIAQAAEAIPDARDGRARRWVACRSRRPRLTEVAGNGPPGPVAGPGAGWIRTCADRR